MAPGLSFVPVPHANISVARVIVFKQRQIETYLIELLSDGMARAPETFCFLIAAANRVFSLHFRFFWPGGTNQEIHMLPGGNAVSGVESGCWSLGLGSPVEPGFE